MRGGVRGGRVGGGLRGRRRRCTAGALPANALALQAVRVPGTCSCLCVYAVLVPDWLQHCVWQASLDGKAVANKPGVMRSFVALTLPKVSATTGSVGATRHRDCYRRSTPCAWLPHAHVCLTCWLQRCC